MRHTVRMPRPSAAWSTNDDRNLNQYKRHDLVTVWKAITQLTWANYCNRRRMPRNLGESLIRVTIPFDTNRRRDPHNYCGTVVKAVIDGMVLAGAWTDDTHEYLEHLAPVLVVDKKGDVVIDIFPRETAYIPCEHGFTCDTDMCPGPTAINF